MKKQWNTSVSRLVLSMSALTWSASIWAAPTPELNYWDGILTPKEIREMQSGQSKVSNLLLDALDSITVGSARIGESKFTLYLKRKVYDNNDVADTWTVIDRIQIKGKTPLYEKASLGSIRHGFYFGALHHLDFYDIRQIRPRDYATLPSAEQRKKEIETSSWYQGFKDDGSQEQIEPEKGETTDRLVDFDDILNRVTFPLRLPLKAESIHKMANGEILSYAATGGVQFGLGVGWVGTPVDGIGLVKAGITASALVSGVFRIAIQKESDRYAHVNVARLRSIDSEVRGGIEASPDILDGIFILEKLSKHLKIIPFEIKYTENLSKNFNVTYRYDLNSATGREAYEQAVLGRFKLSEDLAQDEAGNPRNPTETGVEKISTENSRARRAGIKTKVQLAFIYKKETSRDLSDIETVITLPNGTKKLFQSVAEDSAEKRLFVNRYERLNHTFSVNVDLDLYQRNPRDPEAMTLVTSSRIEDAKTEHHEMMGYILNLEDTLGRFGIFNRPPEFTDPEGSNTLLNVVSDGDYIPLPREHFSNSRFYSQFELQNNQVTDFIQTSDADKWTALEKVFGVSPGLWGSESSRVQFENSGNVMNLLSVPYFVADFEARDASGLKEAKKIHALWKDVQTQTEVKAQVHALARLFHKSKGKYEITKLLRVVENNQRSSFVASSFSPLFGRTRAEGISTLSENDVATEGQRALDRRLRDPNSPARISELRVQALNENQYEVRFVLAGTPKLMAFNLLLDTKWWKLGEKREQGQLLVHNSDGSHFQQGANRIVLDRRDSASPWYSLANSLKSGRDYTLLLSANPEGIAWGAPVGVALSTERN